MPDACYDVVIVGAGTKALPLGLYLNKYGGMQVAFFERHDEAGGGMAGEERTAPGFVAPPHAILQLAPIYVKPVLRDFPEEGREFGLADGVPLNHPSAVIFSEDQKCIVLSGRDIDPDQEKTAAQIARFSGRDADTWLRLSSRSKREKVLAAFEQRICNPPSLDFNPVGRLYDDPEMELDRSWMACSHWEITQELFESDEARSFYCFMVTSGGIDAFERGMAAPPPLVAALRTHVSTWSNGNAHNTAHALVRMNQAMGNKIFTTSEVDKVIIEHGAAKGVRLADGTEIAAKRMVVANVDPATLAFQLVGRDKLTDIVVRKIERLQRNLLCLMWYNWALADAPHYTATEWDPDVADAGFLGLVSKNIEHMRQRDLCRAMGHLPVDEQGNTRLHLCVGNTQSSNSPGHGILTPAGKSVRLTEQFVWPGNQRGWDARRWAKFKRQHAEDVIRHWGRFAPNMTWDNVIGYDPETPWDIANHLPNMGPHGNWCNIDLCLSQAGAMRPIPEWSQYKVPEVKNLYCVSNAWHPGGHAWCYEGYCCYKVISRDHGLRKPWEEQGAPY